eukprot:383986_1
MILNETSSHNLIIMSKPISTSREIKPNQPVHKAMDIQRINSREPTNMSSLLSKNSSKSSASLEMRNKNQAKHSLDSALKHWRKSHKTCKETETITESETSTKTPLQSALSMIPPISSRSRSKRHNNPTLLQFQKPPHRTALHSTNIHNANSTAFHADPLLPFRHIEVGVWEVEPVTRFEDGNESDANNDQVVGVEDGFDLFLENPG